MNWKKIGIGAAMLSVTFGCGAVIGHAACCNANLEPRQIKLMTFNDFGEPWKLIPYLKTVKFEVRKLIYDSRFYYPFLE